MKFCLLYIEHGQIKYRAFDSIQDRVEWIGYFTLATLDNTDDNEIIMTFQGIVEQRKDDVCKIGDAFVR